MQIKDPATSVKKRTRRSKKSHHGVASLKMSNDKPIIRSEGSRRSRRRARKVQAEMPSEEITHDVRLHAASAKTKREAECSFRERLNFCVLDSSQLKVPNCPHGPCLLFGRRSMCGEIIERFFGCAVYRSNRCDYRCPFENTTNGIASSSQNGNVKHKQIRIFRYGKIRKSVNRLAASGTALYYCGNCNDAVSVPHRDPVIGPLKRTAFRRPSQLIRAILDDDGEAQYWFTCDSLDVIANALTVNNCDGVLCIGVPTLFEYFRCSAQRRASIKSFLLDIDSRLSAFYLSTQFAQFSMLTNHLYDPASSAKLDTFLESVGQLGIVCDPPFGIIVESLFATIEQIKGKFEKLHRKYLLYIERAMLYFLKMKQEGVRFVPHLKTCRVNLIIILPMFVAKHVKQCSSHMEMLDYKVCYTNHPKYGRPEKSIVRIFTDFPLDKFVLPSESGYRFCEMCERYVSSENRHCGLCGICPSKDGSPYQHCDRCNRCVKRSYRHCKGCKRCHLVGRCLPHESLLSIEERH